MCKPSALFVCVCGGEIISVESLLYVPVYSISVGLGTAVGRVSEFKRA